MSNKPIGVCTLPGDDLGLFRSPKRVRRTIWVSSITRPGAGSTSHAERDRLGDRSVVAEK